MFSNDSNGKPCLFFLVWPFVPESQRGSQPLTWYFYIIPWLWICELPLVQTIKLRRDLQDDELIIILDLPVFPNIAPSKKFHHWLFSDLWYSFDYFGYFSLSVDLFFFLFLWFLLLVFCPCVCSILLPRFVTPKYFYYIEKRLFTNPFG